MRALGLIVASAVMGCAARPGVPERETVLVTQVALDFATREKGELRFTLRLPAGAAPARLVSWELFLDEARFATGLEGDVQQAAGECVVKTPLTSRHLAWKEGEATVGVLLRGEVDVGDGARLRFRDWRELRVQGRPQLNAPTE